LSGSIPRRSNTASARRFDEGLGWNAFDVVCGALGRYLAIALDTLVKRLRR